MKTVLLFILTILLQVAAAVLGLCVTGGAIAALIAYFTSGLVIFTVGAAVAFTIKCAIAWVVAIVGFFLAGLGTASSA